MGDWTWSITSFGWYHGKRAGFSGRAVVFCRRGCWCADVEVKSECGVDRVYFSEDHESAEHACELAGRAADRALRRRSGVPCDEGFEYGTSTSDKRVMQ